MFNELRIAKPLFLTAYLLVGLALIQLAIGADLTVVLLSIAGSILCIYGFFAFGSNSPSSWILLVYGFGNFIVAIIAKTLMLQTINSFLSSPVFSYYVVFIGGGSIFLAAVLSEKIQVGAPIFRPIYDDRFLKKFGTACFLLGVMFWVLNIGFINPRGDEFGGLMVFNDLIYMGVIAESSRLFINRRKTFSMNARLASMLLTCLVLAFIYNRKLNIIMPIADYLVTSYFFTKRITKSQVVAVAISAVMFLTIVVPLVQYYRFYNIQTLGFTQKLGLITNSFDDIFISSDRYNINRIALVQFKNGYYNYFNDYKLQPVLGRFVSVQQVDPIVSRVNVAGEVGATYLIGDLEHLLPSFLFPAKPKYGAEFYTILHYGIIRYNDGAYPTVPLVAEAYAAYGVTGVFIITFATFFSLFTVLRKISSNLHKNIYSIFFLCEIPFYFAHQQNFGQLWGLILREIPLYIAIFFVLHLLLKNKQSGTR